MSIIQDDNKSEHTLNVSWKRIVIKVGSALIAPEQKGCSARYLLAIAQFIVKCRAKGIQTVLVSSGSVAAGANKFTAGEVKTVALKKAMAAAGQTEMMATWDRFFDFPSAQILLTHDDLRDRKRYESIQETISTLLENGVLPIINENDTIATDALRVGDNDNLSAMTAAASKADALLICSDVDGLYDKNPNEHDDACLIPLVSEINSEIYKCAGGAVSAMGTGGMFTKIQAAEKATAHGIETFIINGFNEDSFNKILQGVNPGTIFKPFDRPMDEPEHWMTHTSKEKGEVIVDNSVNMQADNVQMQMTSDVVEQVNGDFSAGDTILLRSKDGTRLAKAKSVYSSCLLNFVANQQDQQVLDAMQNDTGPIISKENIAFFD